MAHTLSPLATSAIDHQLSPVLDPPKTDFPYPKLDRGRIESDTTLYGHEDDPESLPLKSDQPSSVKDILLEQEGPDSPSIERNDPRAQILSTQARPTLANQKFETEVPRPVARDQRPLAPLAQRRSTGAGQKVQPFEYNSSTDDSSDDSSDFDGDAQRLQRPRSQPEHNPLSASRLNRVRNRPRAPKSQKVPDGRFRIRNEHIRSRGKVAKDGRLNISVNETANSGYLAKALGATISRHLHPSSKHQADHAEELKRQYTLEKANIQIPRMNIVIMVIGSRGDIQPFLKIGKILQDKYHHRVRIATHPTFKKFVEEEIGLEFFSIGGDPSELMSFMVKNPGLIPSLETVKAGEIGRRRESMFEMFQGFWRACINATDNERDTANLKMMGDRFPFVADAIIANPPSFAHYHCAERLNIPLHLVFTFPYSPTQAFPHPLANIKATNVDQSYTNFMSYPLVDLMTWQGLGDLVNRFRVQTLGLEPVSTLWAPGQLSRLKVPITYLWSPGLVPKPADWGPEIDIAGYVFLDLASSFNPPEDLVRFLDRSDGRHIIYIGFGSISGIDDPTAFTKMIFEAVEIAGVKAVISRGWGGMGEGMDKPDGVFMVDNVPHDWLFPQVDAVVHHGGAGTTAAGLKFGKPTMIVPFFGDQPFWSAMVARAGAGAHQALPLKKLNSEKFAMGIMQCLEPDAKEKAQEIAKSIEMEGDGAENAVDSFHRSLPLTGKRSMRCGIFSDRLAVWQIKRTEIQLSALAADLLVENKQLHWSDLALKKQHVWTDFSGPGEPITGAGGVLASALQEAYHGISSISENTKKDIKKHERRKGMKNDKSITNALVMPGRIAHATRGVPVEEVKQQQEEIGQQVNFHGEPEPARAPFSSTNGEYETAGRVTMVRSMTGSTDPGSVPVVLIKDVSKGVGHSTKAFITLPLDMWNALALGFRNAPRLYGDQTVRPPARPITGFRTGVKVAGSELWLGFYDGVTGLVRIPYHDVQDGGLTGLPKGLARGFGGLFLKPISGVLGVGAYTGKGVQAHLRARFKDTQRTEKWIRRARMIQGAKDVQELKNAGKNAPRRTAGAPPGEHELEQVRTKVLTQWTSHERDLVQQARAKERTMSVPEKIRKQSSRVKKT